MDKIDSRVLNNLKGWHVQDKKLNSSFKFITMKYGWMSLLHRKGIDLGQDCTGLWTTIATQTEHHWMMDKFKDFIAGRCFEALDFRPLAFTFQHPNERTNVEYVIMLLFHFFFDFVFIYEH